jgi:hypothetical protein
VRRSTSGMVFNRYATARLASAATSPRPNGGRKRLFGDELQCDQGDGAAMAAHQLAVSSCSASFAGQTAKPMSASKFAP